MGKLKSDFGGSALVVGPQTDLTKDNWADRAKAFIATKGKDALGFVCSNGSKPQYPVTEAQWVAWMRWFESKGIPTLAKQACGVFTVPTEWPEDFDVECGPSDRLARLRRPPQNTDADRAATAARMRSLVNAAIGASEMPREQRRKNWEITPTEAEQLLREAASKPMPQLSPALRRTLGLRDDEEDAA